MIIRLTLFSLFLILSTVCNAAITTLTDDSVDCGTTDFPTENGAMSFMWKGKINTISGSLSARFFARESPGTVQFFHNATTATMSFSVAGGTTLSVITSTALSTATEYTVIVTWDGSVTATNVHIYVNGTEASYSTQTSGVTPTDDVGGTLRLFNRSGNDRTLDAITHEIAFWNAVISADDIAKLSSTTRRNVVKEMSVSPIRYYKMDDGTSGSADAATFTDTMGNVNCTGNDGANNTGLTWSVDAITSTQRIIQ